MNTGIESNLVEKLLLVDQSRRSFFFLDGFGHYLMFPCIEGYRAKIVHLSMLNFYFFP